MITQLIRALNELGLSLSFFRLVEFPTFRLVMGILTSLVVSLIFGHKVIVFLYRKKMRDTSGDLTSIQSTSKKGTPTAGGLLLIVSTVSSALLWSDLSNPFLLWLLYGTIFSGIIGFVDDYSKVRFKSSLAGLGQKQKTLGLLIMIIPFVLYFVSQHNPITSPLRTQLFVPFFKHPLFDMGSIFYSVFMIFAIFSIINAVNIADGLDGLLSGMSISPFIVYGVIAFISGQELLARIYLYPYLPGLVEVTIFCGILLGSVIGFLWYNCYPADVFMGDTGSLMIGTNMAMIAFMTKQEILFVFIGGIFIFEIFTSLVQQKIGDSKRFGRRFFYRAPFHHTLTHMGIPEPKAVTKMILVSIFLSLIGLLSIKLR